VKATAISLITVLLFLIHVRIFSFDRRKDQDRMRRENIFP